MRTLILPVAILTTVLAQGSPPSGLQLLVLQLPIGPRRRRPSTGSRSGQKRSCRCRSAPCVRRGWLQRQLQIQAAGLTGHLDEFWPDVGKNSGWLGGTGESWERGPYFVDGLVPLAYLLGDERLIAKARNWVEWTLTHQGEDGRIGPPKEHRLVAEHGDAEGTHAVPGGDRRSARDSADAAVLRLPPGERPHSVRCTSGRRTAGPTSS